MLIESSNESVARNRELSKSHHARRISASYEANAQAVAIPFEKSANEERATFLTSFLCMRVLYQIDRAVGNRKVFEKLLWVKKFLGGASLYSVSALMSRSNLSNAFR